MSVYGFDQLTADTPSGSFKFVTHAWWPEGNGLRSLRTRGEVEHEATKVGPGDWLEGPVSWAPTVHQWRYWLFPVDPETGAASSTPEATLQSHLDAWLDAFCFDGADGFDAVYDIAGGGSRSGRLSQVKVQWRDGSQKPTGWPIVVEATTFAPFVPGGGS